MVDAARCRKVFLDMLILLIVYGLIIIVDTSVEPTKRGIFCDDPNLRYPHKDNTVPVPVLYLVSHGIPVAFMSISSFCRYNCGIKMSLYHTLTSYILGAGCLHLTANVVKKKLGWLRPDFLTVCRPDKSSLYCTYGYTSDYTCTGSDIAAIKHSRTSFPSLHAAVSTYGMVFLIIHIQHYYIKDGQTFLFWKSLQGLCLLWFSFASVTRIVDHKHHWGDVIAGFLAGFVMAVWVAYQWVTFSKVEEEVRDAVQEEFIKEDSHRHILEVKSDIARGHRSASL